MSGWNENWNKPEDELTPSEKAARHEYLDGLKWDARFARSRRPAPTPAGQERVRRESTAYGQGWAAAETPKRRRAWIGYTVAGGMLALGYILIACGAHAADGDPSSSTGVLLGLAGYLVGIAALPVIVISGYLDKRPERDD